jgi:hypothetical protein
MTTAGVVEISDAEYHSDRRALSQSGAKLLLPPSAPAHFRYAMDHPPKTKPHYDMGHAVHTLVLGAGPQIDIIAADDWRTKAAQTQRKAAHAAGHVPLLTHEYAEAYAMRDAVLSHPIAGRLFDPATGDPERSLYWQDDETGTPLRGRVDWLRHAVGGMPTTIVDLKTTKNANPKAFGKTAADFAYHRQQFTYRWGARELLGVEVGFVFVLVETEPPYLVSTPELDDEAEAIGAREMRQAIDIYAECMETGDWPGYSTEIEQVSLPRWYTRQFEVNEW